MVSCPACEVANGNYQWDCAPCRARYIRSLKNREAQNAWLAFWSMREQKMVDEVRAILNGETK